MTDTEWIEANRKHLMASISLVRERLVAHTSKKERDWDFTELEEDVARTGSAMPYPSALQVICQTFGLSDFERDILLLCAGMELDSSFAGYCASINGDDRRVYPTFSLSLAVLLNGSWEAVTPSAPLRRWKFLEIGNGDTLTQSPLKIDESVLHFLTGVNHIDERLAGICIPLSLAHDIVPSHLAISERISAMWKQPSHLQNRQLIQLFGRENAGKRSITSHAGEEAGITFFALRADEIPQSTLERDAFARIWEREAALNRYGLYLECEDVEKAETIDSAKSLLEELNAIAVISSRNPLRLVSRITVNIEVSKPDTKEQLMLWNEMLKPLSSRLNGMLSSLVSQFDMDTGSIFAAGAEAITSFAGKSDTLEIDVDAVGKSIWNSCRVQTRGSLEEHTQRINPTATWDDLILPESIVSILREIAAHVRQRSKVYNDWGFAKKVPRGLGISALFGGQSGTGKTMAAEVLANELALDLFRIDLSAVVNKYIGETEKNLRKVFDAAEDGGAILLFDEADALFGKRSEVKDSHDRYSNIEVSYLLQRMETYRGLAILTTNMKSSLDQAFVRRIRFILQFPFPDVAQRAKIWEKAFPPDAPLENLDWSKLALLNVSGGNIRNVALNAAFLAAEDGESIQMKYILKAAINEYQKLEKPLTKAEIVGWV
ncbi:MAG: AAA family ATPase [Nitrospinota bacterium]|nr:AAA family ATPase [Nitrospinota bacterium]